MAHLDKYIKGNYGFLVGWTIVDVGAAPNENDEEQPFPCLIVQKACKQLQVSFLMDEEANGPGWLAVDPVMDAKEFVVAYKNGEMLLNALTKIREVKP